MGWLSRDVKMYVGSSVKWNVQIFFRYNTILYNTMSYIWESETTVGDSLSCVLKGLLFLLVVLTDFLLAYILVLVYSIKGSLVI